MPAPQVPLYAFSLKGVHTFYSWDLQLLQQKRLTAVDIYSDWGVTITEIEEIGHDIVGLAGATLLQSKSTQPRATSTNFGEYFNSIPANPGEVNTSPVYNPSPGNLQ